MDSVFFCKCSVCFENDSETELINCGDQFCLECLERYVEFWIREGSWGIQKVKLGCPVCGGEVVEDDWMPLVSEELLETWRRFEQKRAAVLKTFQLTRNCPVCSFAQPIVGFPVELACAVDAFHQVGSSLASFLDALDAVADWRSAFHLEVVLDLMHELACGELIDEDGWLETVGELWRDFLQLLMALLGSASCAQQLSSAGIDILMRFARLFLRLFTLAIDAGPIDCPGNRAILLAAQLDFQLSFPFSRCDCCGVAFCLPCRQPGWHLAPQQHSPLRPRQCPRCFVAVVKDPEGCNEVVCSFCGFKFCWACGRKWTRSCGIYKCTNEALEGNNNSGGETDEPASDDFQDAIEVFSLQDRQPEVGVPNVRDLEKRLMRRL